MKTRLLFILCAVWASQAFSDTQITSKIKFQIDSEKPLSMTRTIFIKGDLIRANVSADDGSANTYSIYDSKLQKTYIINPAAKTISIMDTASIKGMQEISEQILGNLSIQKTNITKNINGINCEVYTFSANFPISINGTLCSAKDLQIKDWKNIQNFLDNGPIKLGNLMQKIQGTPISMQAEISMMGATSKTSYEITNISNQTIPASMFVIPSDYKVLTNQKQLNPKLLTPKAAPAAQ